MLWHLLRMQKAREQERLEKKCGGNMRERRQGERKSTGMNDQKRFMKMNTEFRELICMYTENKNKVYYSFIVSNLWKEMTPLTLHHKFAMTGWISKSLWLQDPLALTYKRVHQALWLPVQLLRNQRPTLDTAVSITQFLGPLWFTRIKAKIKLRHHFFQIFSNIVEF